MKKGDYLELEITGYAFEGKGICKIPAADNPDKKFVIFVEGAYPGDVVKAQIRRKKRSFAEAKTVEVIKPSSFRVEPKCKYFGYCGGCKQQDMNYENQLFYKQEQVKDIFERIGGFADLNIEEILPSGNIFFYRNKMEFSFSDKRWLLPTEINKNDDIKDRNFALGMHIPRIYDKVLDIDECWLQSDISNKILNFTRDFFKERQASIYTTKTHSGYLRNLVIKQSYHTNDLMVNLITSEDDKDLFGEYSDKLSGHIPEITTIVNNINKKKAMTAFGDYEKVYLGDGNIYDRLGNYNFRISANSFFQTNTHQAERLYDVAVNFADFKGDEVVFDLYSGAGTITIYISNLVKEVYGFETVESAIEDAKLNAESNGIKNVRFFSADLNKSISYMVKDKTVPKPDVIIADPPRGGMNPRTVRDILRIAPERVVYISCNPATQARDIKELCEGGYKLIKMKPVDMFPHTFHIENVVLLHKI